MNTTTTDPELHLELAEVPWRYYWRIEVGKSDLWLELHRRNWLGRRSSLSSHRQYDSVSHKGLPYLSQEVLNELQGRSHKLWDAERTIVPTIIGTLSTLTAGTSTTVGKR